MIRINTEAIKTIEDIKRLEDMEEKNAKIVPVTMDKVDVGHTGTKLDSEFKKEEDNNFDSILQEEIKKYL